MKQRWLAAVVAGVLLVLVAACGGPKGAGPAITSFAADPATIESGGQSTLSWVVSGATSLELEPGGVDVTGKTSQVVAPVVTTSYTLTATGAGGSSKASTTVTVGGGGSTASATVRAAQGGSVELAGARLDIPSGALDQDTVVTLVISDAPAAQESNPLKPVGPRVGVDLGGAALVEPAALTLPYTPGTDVLYVVTESGRLPAADEMPGTRVHAATLAGEGAVANVTGPATYEVQAIANAPAPQGLAPAAEGLGDVSLQVPFYWQAGYPWCSPTSTAMYLNYFQVLPGLAGTAVAPGGFVSNYALAGSVGQDANSGSWPVSFLQAATVPTDLYSWLVWDADLIPSAPFTSYVVLATTGVFGLAPMRPVLTTSDKINHAFVITGLSANGIYINDGNARWAGTHPSMTWDQFRVQNEVGTKVNELGTLLVLADPRPENARRGSLELGPRTAEDPARTVRFENPSDALIADWAWDGVPYRSGYYFLDETNPTTWPLDAEYGRVLPRSSRLQVRFNVVNVTENLYDYDVVARLYVDDAFKLQRQDTVNVGEYSRAEVDLDFGNLAATVGAITAPVTGRVELDLSQGGVLQDVKHVSFRLGPDPTGGITVDVPQPSILVDGQRVGFVTLRGVPITLQSRTYDRYVQPDGPVPPERLSWSEGGTFIATGATLTRAFDTTGDHVITLTGTGEYGATASAGATVRVIDPVRVNGEVVIDYPADGTGIGVTAFGPITVNLVGHATYSDGTPVPGDRLHWTGPGGEDLGTGSGTVTTVPGFCSTHSYTFGLTARTVDGSPIGTDSTTIQVFGPPC